MYSWIWGKLPFGLYGKLTGSLVLLTTAGALLWFYVFPWAEPLLPFDDVQVGTTTGDQGPANPDPDAPGLDPAVPADPAAPVDPDEEGYELPYSVETNNPDPSSTR
jgi:hypothetical protein